MDKYEYKLKLEQIRNLIEAKDYEAAAQIADSINWKKVKSVATLCMIGELFEKTRRLEESREILLMAYERSPVGRNIIYRLAHVAIKLQSLEEAQEYYEEFLEIAPHDNMRYVLKYEIAKAKGESLDVLISILEEFKEREYTEEWAFELAYLYHKSGQAERCVDVCDELILWFGEGRYVEKALELKMMYQPLNQMQEDKYRRFKQQKEGVVEVSPRDALSSGEIVHETVKIPSILSDTGRFNTLNLQAELAKSMEQIMAATKQETVDDTIDNFKKIVEDASQMEAEQQQQQQGWSGQLPTQEQLDQGWSGQLPSQEQLDQGWSGQLPGHEMLDQGWSGQLPSQEQLDQGWSGQLPGQEMLDQGWSGQLPGQEMLDQGWSGQLPGQEMLDQGWSGQLPGQEMLDQGWSGQLPGQEQLEQDWSGQLPGQGMQAEEFQSQAESAMQQGWSLPPEENPIAQSWQAPLSEEKNAQSQFLQRSVQPVGQGWQERQPAQPAGQGWQERQPVQPAGLDQTGRWPTSGMSQNDAVSQPAPGMPRKSTAPQPAPEMPWKSMVPQPTSGMPQNMMPQSARKMPQKSTEPQLGQNAGFGSLASQPEQSDVTETVYEQKPALQPDETVQSYELNQLEWPRRIPEEKRRAWLGQSAEQEPVQEAPAPSAGLQSTSGDEGEEASAQDLPLQEEIPDPALDIDFRGILTEDPDEEEQQPDTENTSGSSVHITGKMSLAEILAAWEKRKAEVEEAVKSAGSEAKGNAADKRESQTEQEDIAEVKRRAIQQVEQLVEWLKSGDQLFPGEGEAESQNQLEQKCLSDAQLSEQECDSKTQASSVHQEGTAVPEEVRPEAAEAPEAVWRKGGVNLEEAKREVQNQQSPNHLFQKQEELEQKILQRQQQVQQVLEREVREEHLLQNEITVEDSGEEELPLTQLNEEQQQIFTYFTLISGMEQQLCQALEGARHRKRNNRTSNSGNLIITGGKRSGKTMLATDFVKAYQRLSGHPSVKVGKISAEMLNQKDIRVLLQAVEGGYLIVENAGGLSKQSVEKLSALMEGDTRGVMVILEDGKAGIKKALARSPEFARKFTERIHIPIFTSDELVAFAKAYAKEHHCEIEDMGILALYNSISNIQKLDEPTTLTEVKEIMDDAIVRANRGGLKKLFGGKRNTENGMILIKEKDFRD